MPVTCEEREARAEVVVNSDTIRIEACRIGKSHRQWRCDAV